MIIAKIYLAILFFYKKKKMQMTKLKKQLLVQLQKKNFICKVKKLNWMIKIIKKIQVFLKIKFKKIQSYFK